MRCPFCGNPETQVKDSRPSEDGAAIRRRRSCSECGGRFTTFERVQLRELLIVKRSGRRTPFDREKLERSISLATRKRQIDPERIDRMVSGIVRQLESLGETEIGSEVVGELIMKALRSLDSVAYVRYASVYRDFQETSDFAKFLGAEGFDSDGMDAPLTPAPAGNPEPTDPSPIRQGLGEQDLSATDDA
ncbi:transcriptional regulator NrdR [Asticcacaulis sp. DW145]|nr:transcriptional regulator NrdR [Asticcacaulis sp. DW145]